MAKPKGLGRGLDALLSADVGPSESDQLRELPPSALQPGRYQPRTHMEPGAIEELAASIKAQGMIQPIVARPIGPDRYEIIAGERRWRASQIAQLERIPVLVRDVKDDAALAMALIENLQREDLNALEEAQGIQRLITEFGMTHQSAADALGRSRSAVSNLLRLLQLPHGVQTLLAEGRLEMGHVRSLLALDPSRQLEFAHKIAAAGLSVRETERAVTQALAPDQFKRRKTAPDGDIRGLEQELSDRLGLRVEVQMTTRKSGRLVFHFTSLDNLDTVLKRLR
ncbi:MAG: ParB/RepB/Spo0J family partition protein [Burkholderiales bacterium]